MGNNMSNKDIQEMIDNAETRMQRLLASLESIDSDELSKFIVTIHDLPLIYTFNGKSVSKAEVCHLDKASRFGLKRAITLANESNNANGEKGQAINLYDAYIAEIRRTMTFKNDLRDFLKEKSVTDEA